MTEREIQTKGVALLRKLGFRVWVTSQRRASSVTKGMPDVWAMHPGRKLALWWEAKAPKGILSVDQLKFGTTCQDCGVEYLYGGLDVLERYLKNVKVIAA